MQKTPDQQTRSESKTQIVEKINACLRSGDYSRALDLLRGAAADFPKDAQLAELEQRAQDGVRRSAEANRLITESQELFAQQKSAEAIQLLRKAHELDKSNSLARAILANALVEHAQSVVETDWLEAEKLTNQALNLNPAHPTAKTILNLIVARKETSPVEDWAAQARKLQSAGDLFAALAWVAEGLAVHPHDPKLLQIQDEIQRDQEARRRQARRGDLEDLRRLQREIDGATDVAAKQALAVRIQTLAAKHWTDGEILSIANALLLRLGFVSQESSGASPRGKGATLILHVPRPSAPPPPRAEASPAVPKQVSPVPAVPTVAAPSQTAPSQVAASPIPPGKVPAVVVVPTEVPFRRVEPDKVPPDKVAAVSAPQDKVASDKAAPSGAVAETAPAGPPESKPAPLQVATVPAAEPVRAPKLAPPSPQPKQPARSNFTSLIIVSAAAILLVAATFFFTREHYAPPTGNVPAASTVSTPAASTTGSAPAVSAPVAATPVTTTPAHAAPAQPAPAQLAPEPSPPAFAESSATPAGKGALANQPPAEPAHNLGTLLIVAGQDDARVFLDGKLQRQLTQGGQLRLPNLELKDHVVQVSKSGFQDSTPQKIRVRQGEEARLVFNLQPQPRLASLTIQGGAPGTAVLVDQTPVGTIQPDGTLSVATVNPGDHTIELRRDRFKSRQLKKHFVAGGTISLAAADAVLEAASGELKITFTPADASVAIARGDLLKIVNSGVPLNLAAGTYTLTARTAERVTRSSTLEVVAGQSKTVDLSLAPNGMSKWDDPSGWKHEKDSFIRKGGDFVLYGIAPTSGTFVFSAMLTKGHFLQWVLNYSDPKNYVLFQMDDNNFYRSVIRNGKKADEIIVPDKGDKKSFRTLQIRVSPTELVHQIKHGNSWTVLDRWTQPGVNLSQGKFGLYLPGDDQVALTGFAHYADLNIR